MRTVSAPRVQKKFMKKRIIMLVASDPDSDPRIDWEARYSPRQFAVTVMGACGPELKGPRQKLWAGYAIVRLARNGRGCAGFLRTAGKLMVARWLLPILTVLLLPFAVAVAVLELLRRSVKRRIGRRPVYETLRQAARYGLTHLGV